MSAGVPESFWLLESFLNSVDVESGQDDLAGVARFRRWLRDHKQESAAATESDVVLARQVRDELRDELQSHHSPAARDRSRLDRLAADIGLAARFDSDGRVRLAPSGTGVRAMLGEVLAVVVRAVHDGTWNRLKICQADTCRYVYYDKSKNGSRRWCSMEICGNRSKTRAYRERKVSGGPE
jgi:predicted RNA-binding Zn ribbon-like protein